MLLKINIINAITVAISKYVHPSKQANRHPLFLDEDLRFVVQPSNFRSVFRIDEDKDTQKLRISVNGRILDAKDGKKARLEHCNDEILKKEQEDTAKEIADLFKKDSSSCYNPNRYSSNKSNNRDYYNSNRNGYDSNYRNGYDSNNKDYYNSNRNGYDSNYRNDDYRKNDKRQNSTYDSDYGSNQYNRNDSKGGYNKNKNGNYNRNSGRGTTTERIISNEEKERTQRLHGFNNGVNFLVEPKENDTEDYSDDEYEQDFKSNNNKLQLKKNDIKETKLNNKETKLKKNDIKNYLKKETKNKVNNSKENKVNNSKEDKVNDLKEEKLKSSKLFNLNKNQNNFNEDDSNENSIKKNHNDEKNSIKESNNKKSKLKESNNKKSKLKEGKTKLINLKQNLKSANNYDDSEYSSSDMSNESKEGYVWTFFPVHKGGNDKTIVVRYGRDKCLTHSMALKKCKFEDERIGLFNLDCEFYFDIFPFNTEKSLEKLEYYLNKLKNSNNKTEERIKQAECTPYKSPNPCLPSDKCDEIKKNYPVIYLPEKNDILKEALMKTVGDGSSRFIN